MGGQRRHALHRRALAGLRRRRAHPACRRRHGRPQRRRHARDLYGGPGERLCANPAHHLHGHRQREGLCLEGRRWYLLLARRRPLRRLLGREPAAAGSRLRVCGARQRLRRRRLRHERLRPHARRGRHRRRRLHAPGALLSPAAEHHHLRLRHRGRLLGRGPCLHEDDALHRPDREHRLQGAAHGPHA